MQPRRLLTEDYLRLKQHIIVQEILSSDAKMIISHMGSGKTAATLTALRKLHDATESRHTLIVAPLRVATDVWPQEIAGWQHTRLMSHAVACGTPEEREAAIAARAEITVINRENLVWLAKHLGSVENWPYDTVVIDESSMFKEANKRTKPSKRKGAGGEVKVSAGGNINRFGVMTAARRKINRIYELTGTPGEASKLWPQIYLLDQGAALGRTVTAFRERWFNYNPYSYTYEPKTGAEAEIMSRVKHLMTSLPPDQLVEKPISVTVPVRFDDRLKREYASFKRTLVSREYDVQALTSGVLANKLLQFSNGSMYRDDQSIAKVHDLKLQALESLVEESDGENLLVFYGFKFDLEQIRKKYPHAVVLNESKTAVADWNAGRIKMLLAHPASCAHGLNLQFGGHIAIWYGLTWSLELYQQANARLPRPGQTRQVAIYHIIAEDTYDDVALDALDRKDTSQKLVIDSVVNHLFVD